MKWLVLPPKPAWILFKCWSLGVVLLILLYCWRVMYQGQASEAASVSLLFTAPLITNQMSGQDLKVNFI